MYIKLSNKDRNDIISDLTNGLIMPFHLIEEDGTIVNYCFKSNDGMITYDYDVRTPLENGGYCLSEEFNNVPMSIKECKRFFKDLEGFHLQWCNVDCEL